jgi:hypothetical protein
MAVSKFPNLGFIAYSPERLILPAFQTQAPETFAGSAF